MFDPGSRQSVSNMAECAMDRDNACQTADNPVIFLPEENRKKGCFLEQWDDIFCPGGMN
jgi:hypothetical protein